MRELAHRAKNQLAVVKGMALQTAKQSQNLDEFVTQLAERIQGLAQSQDLMLRQNWQGAWIADLVRAHLDLFGAANRAQVSGPPIFVNANAVQNIGFALHELATNASKHGAFSAAGGQVSIRWDGPDENDRIYLEWMERDGPTVQSLLRKGFGHMVLTRLVPAALQGTSTLIFDSAGVRWELRISGKDVLATPVANTEISSS
jgi:two-component sensor histidine kinase